MKRHLTDLAVLAVGCTVAVIVLLLAEPSWRAVTVRAYVFALGAVAMLSLIAAAGDAIPRRRRSLLDTALATAPAPQPPLPQLERTIRETTLAQTRAFDLHRLLLPQLRAIAEARLARVGRDPGPDTLGRWWDLLRPDREPPDDRFAPGIAVDDLRALVRDLERIG